MDNPKRFQVGDVVQWAPADRHCREGTAVARAASDGRIKLSDTFWGSYEPHILTEDEAATAELLFNLADYDELDQYDKYGSAAKWEQYAPEDRQLITMQHGLQKRWFIRKGAQPDLPTRIANAERKLAERMAALESARRQVLWAEEELAELRAVGGGVGE